MLDYLPVVHDWTFPTFFEDHVFFSQKGLVAYKILEKRPWKKNNCMAYVTDVSKVSELVQGP